MDMDWNTVISAVLAGGIAGQLVTLFGGNWLTNNREYKKWKLTEKHKLYSELVTTATLTPKEDTDIENWTYKIRDISQRIHILHDGGVAPESLSGEIETIFRMAQSFKEGDRGESWKTNMRDAIRKLRTELASDLSNTK